MIGYNNNNNNNLNAQKLFEQHQVYAAHPLCQQGRVLFNTIFICKFKC